MSIRRLSLTGNAFPCCYQCVLREADKYFLSIEVFLKKWLNPLSWPSCILLVKAHESIPLPLVCFSKRGSEKINRDLYTCLIAKKVTLRRDTFLKIKA